MTGLQFLRRFWEFKVGGGALFGLSDKLQSGVASGFKVDKLTFVGQ